MSPFCCRLLSSVSATLQHCSTEHQVNVVDLIRKYSKNTPGLSAGTRVKLRFVTKLFLISDLDDYGYIKMINFIRLTVSTACNNICYCCRSEELMMFSINLWQFCLCRNPRPPVWLGCQVLPYRGMVKTSCDQYYKMTPCFRQVTNPHQLSSSKS